ncbi:MAG TPA: FUSC family protein [Verrucomicrobiae bacterium]
MRWLHSSSLRYALALWLATVTALFVAFVAQLEPAQWAGITVWIMYVQVPRMNYSKVIWWAFGTVTGAFMAVILTVFFNQMPEILLLFLALWLAACAAAATLVTNYRAYGAVLAGYTCAIVTMSAVETPDLIFRLAVTRVSCIFIGMASAIFFMGLLLPKHGHWRETVHHLGEHFKATLLQAAKAINPDAGRPNEFTWRHMADRLSTVEHTLDITTAETADSRIHTSPARALAATLFNLLARAQAMEIHLTRPGAIRPRPEIAVLLNETQTILAAMAHAVADQNLSNIRAVTTGIERLQEKLTVLRKTNREEPAASMISNQFLINRMEEILNDVNYAIRDWGGLFGEWTARRTVSLAVHRDYVTALIYGVRMFLAMGMVSALWFITQWPSGSQLVLFTAVVCSLLSLLDHAPTLGFPFLKSAVFCAIMAYVEAFWLFQRSDGFVILALMLGIFLLPAAYAYRHPRLIGGAVVSMLIFYGLTMPANQMTYDIAAFLNNGLALICATACGFFAFHTVRSLDAPSRQFWLLRAVRKDLAAEAISSDQQWTSCMFDRIRLLHRAIGTQGTEPLDAENEMLLSLQLGLRQHQLRLQLATLAPKTAELVAAVLVKFKEIARHPNIVALFIHSTCLHLEENMGDAHENAGVIGELREMSFLLESSTRLYIK